MFGPASPEAMRAAQILTGLAMALFLMVGFVPGLRRHARTIQAGVLVAYLLGAAVLIAGALLR